MVYSHCGYSLAFVSILGWFYPLSFEDQVLFEAIVFFVHAEVLVALWVESDGDKVSDDLVRSIFDVRS